MNYEMMNETDLEDLYDETINWQRVLERYDCGYELHKHIGNHRDVVATILQTRYKSNVS